jgi:hypothetical protein
MISEKNPTAAIGYHPHSRNDASEDAFSGRRRFRCGIRHGAVDKRKRINKPYIHPEHIVGDVGREGEIDNESEEKRNQTYFYCSEEYRFSWSGTTCTRGTGW